APLSDDNLIKIMEEVLDNAFKFSPVGTAVIVSTRIEQGSYVLCVQDHGPGMSAENILHIGAYMQFQRLLKEQQGVGLGLIIVKRLAELYGGALRIESTPVGGTTVCVYLPIR
ncbi:MAG: ATP-binding protein, partial [Anaerolineae bacterium]|nr:ATP-binding protein [Anaerolineae bacterium]